MSLDASTCLRLISGDLPARFDQSAEHKELAHHAARLETTSKSLNAPFKATESLLFMPV